MTARASLINNSTMFFCGANGIGDNASLHGRICGKSAWRHWDYQRDVVGAIETITGMSDD